MMQATKVWWDGEKLMAEQIDTSAIYKEQQPQQEPVAWLVDNGGDSILIRHSQNFPGVFVGSEFNKRPLVFGDTSPPAQRTWVGLTDEEIEKIWNSGVRAFFLLARAIEATLKEKNT